MAIAFSVFLSFLAVYGFRYEVTDDYLKLTNTYSFFWLLLFCFFTLILYRVFHEKDKPLVLCSALFALVISTFSSLGVSMAKMRRLSWIWESRSYLVNFLNLYYARFILIKNHFRNERFNEDPGRFLSLWLDLAKRYPATYVESLLMNNYGYWYPEINYWYSDFKVVKPAEIADIRSAPILKIGVVESVLDFVRSYKFLKIPLGNLLFNAAACFWVWIFCGVYCLYRNRKKLILFMPGFALWLGILVTPINNDFRYVYGLFTALPLLLAAVLAQPEEDRPER